MTDGRAHTRQSVDWWLIGTYLVLVVIGWINIFAATHTSEPGSLLNFEYRAGKQFLWILTSLGLAATILWLTSSMPRRVRSTA
jgi:rod shape determining protein RodA